MSQYKNDPNKKSKFYLFYKKIFKQISFSHWQDRTVRVKGSSQNLKKIKMAEKKRMKPIILKKKHQSELKWSHRWVMNMEIKKVTKKNKFLPPPSKLPRTVPHGGKTSPQIAKNNHQKHVQKHINKHLRKATKRLPKGCQQVTFWETFGWTKGATEPKALICAKH